MKTVELTKAGAIEQIIAGGPAEEVVVCRDSQPVALITPFGADDFYWYRREHDPEFVESIGRARGQVARGHVTSQEEMIRKLSAE